MPTDFPIANSKQRWVAALVALSAGACLGAGCVPVAQSLVDSLVAPWLAGQTQTLAWLGCAAFPSLAAVFYFSFPRPRFAKNPRVWVSLPLAGGIALAYGFFDGVPPFTHFLSDAQTRLALAWALVFAPLGEEWLFRGWLFSVAHRLWPGVYATATNPLPLAVWVSALAFSFWHLQNAETESLGRVLFQTAYALPLGLWLGWLRWKTDGLAAPLAAHLAINFATMLA
jgi:membrane protease YdiL (CAAX protease family)